MIRLLSWWSAVVASLALTASGCRSYERAEGLVVEAQASLASIEGYVALGVNSKGYREFRRVRDDAVVVLIPGGYFTKRAYHYLPPERAEGEQQSVRSFLMDKYEVTNTQVSRYFRENPGWVLRAGTIYASDGLTPLAVEHQWGLTFASGAPEPQVGFEKHPAVGTSGHLALAYARWVGGDLPQGIEYEKAAAGPSGLLFPWGDHTTMPDSTRANSYLDGPRRTMPVGSYPWGASPYGCLDMAGNVYERTYWDNVKPVEGERGDDPWMIKGGSWLSPHWWNLRCICRCGQPMDAMDGSVGFRVVVRDNEILTGLGARQARLRVVCDLYDAFEEASSRNVPVFVWLGVETCGQCDRVQAQVFRDPRFVAYCNENLVVMVGLWRRNGNGVPKLPLGPNETFFAHTDQELSKLEQVYTDFRDDDRVLTMVPLPPEGLTYNVSPGMYVLNPHGDLIESHEQTQLFPDAAFRHLKTGAGVDKFLDLFRQAQEQLGPGQTYGDYAAGKPGPETTWRPPS